MSEPSANFPCRFSFTYRDDEVGAFYRKIRARQDPGPDFGNFYATMIALAFGLGLTVAAARYMGWVEPDAFKPVMVTAYVAFFAGAFAYYIALRIGYRRIARLYREERRARNLDCEAVFEDAGVFCKTDRIEMRVPWSAVTEVRETDPLVVVWIGRAEGFAVPVRLFADADARKAFVAAAHARAVAARRA